MENQEYFLRNRTAYKNAVSSSAGLYEQCGKVIEPYVQGRVLDIGSGGIINYSLDRVEQLVCQDIIFDKQTIGHDKVSFVYGDFYDYKPLFSPDTVIAQFLFHHLSDDYRLIDSLSRLRQSMPKSACLIIAEVEMPGFLDKPQRVLLKPALKLLAKPEVRFFTQPGLMDILSRAGFKSTVIKSFRIQGMVNPAPVIFPRIRIPGWLYPFRIRIIKAFK